MSKAEAGKAWKRLSAADRHAAVAALPAYAAYRQTKPDLQIVHAVRFLSQRRFDGYVEKSKVGIEMQGAPIAFDVRGIPVTKAKALEFVYAWKAGGSWHTPWGAPPDDPACVVPRSILDEAGVPPPKSAVAASAPVVRGPAENGSRVVLNGISVADRIVVDTICADEWVPAWGPAMGEFGCQVPERVMRAVEERRAAQEGVGR